MKKEESFTSHSTGSTYIQNEVCIYMQNQKSGVSNPVQRCGLQYVGETENPLHIRMNGHRSDINTRKIEKPVAAHFTHPDHSLNDLQVMRIGKKSDVTWWKPQESYWVFMLGTMTPTGLNTDE